MNKKKQILEGLFSKDLSIYLLGRVHVDEDELLSDMFEYERLNESFSIRIRLSNDVKSSSTQKLTISRQNSDATMLVQPRKEVAAKTERKRGPVLQSCFNCDSKAHISPQCPKPKKEKEACYECGSTTHQVGTCPNREKRSGNGEKSAGLMNIDVADDSGPPDEYPVPYEVQCEFNVPVEVGEECRVTFNAVVDTGSPISLLKSEYVPNNRLVVKSADNCNFLGINGAKVDVLGIYETNVSVNNHLMYFKFYIVSNGTLTASAILGRDLLTKHGFKVEFINNTLNIINLNEECNKKDVHVNLNEVLCIDYEIDGTDCKSNVNVNPDLSLDLRNEFIDTYNVEYLVKNDENPQTNVDSDFEMKIVLKHEQPISFRPRRLSFSEQGSLRIIINELLAEGIIRPSNSPYSSPIVLVKKKDNSFRLYVDYRELNKITVKDNFPTPLIDDQKDKLKDKNIFSSLDLKNGFYHIRMNEASIPLHLLSRQLGSMNI